MFPFFCLPFGRAYRGFIKALSLLSANKIGETGVCVPGDQNNELKQAKYSVELRGTAVSVVIICGCPFHVTQHSLLSIVVIKIVISADLRCFLFQFYYIYMVLRDLTFSVLCCCV